MKKIVCFMLVFFFLFAYNGFHVNAEPTDQPLQIVGVSCILMDVKSGKVLYEKNANQKMEPARPTKIMTAILALENGNLSDIVVTGKEPTLADGTRIYLEEGEKLNLEQMLYAMLLNSANDAAVAIAEHVGGNVADFVNMMNKKAKEIGAKNTNFINPNGLSDDGHLTTAYDLALISRYALNNLPEFRKIVSTKTFNIPWQGKEWDRKLINLNKLLWNYDGADGVKTGYTTSAGQTLVASATKDGLQLIAVVLKSQGQHIWNDAGNLLNYGFTNFQKMDVIDKGLLLAGEKVKYGDTVQLETSTDFTTVLPKGENSITKKIIIKPHLKAPVKKGAVLGELEFYNNGIKIGSVDLIAKNDVERKIYTNWWFWPVSLLLFIYTPFRIAVGIRRYKRYKRQARYISYIKRYR